MLLREFAVDPGLFADFSAIRYVLDGMGVHSGRMLAKYPKDWQKRAYAACRELTPLQKSRAEVKIQRAKALFLSGGRPFDASKCWVENAVVEHSRFPFQAVIVDNASAEKCTSESILSAGELDPDLPPWKVSIDCVQNRDAASLCHVAKPLLNISKEIVFVDRYFEGGVGHGKPLAEFLKEVIQGVQPIRIEYHCDDRSTFSYFANQISRLDRFISLPVGFRLRFVRWKQIPEGDSPHPRYILTDRGGLRYDYGLSEDDGRSTDIGILGPEVYDRRWGEYSATGTAFEFADGLELRDHKLYKLLKQSACFVSDTEILSS